MVMLNRTKATQMFKQGTPINYQITPCRQLQMTIKHYKVTPDFVTELKKCGNTKRTGTLHQGTIQCQKCKKCKHKPKTTKNI